MELAIPLFLESIVEAYCCVRDGGDCLYIGWFGLMPLGREVLLDILHCVFNHFCENQENNMLQGTLLKRANPKRKKANPKRWLVDFGFIFVRGIYVTGF